MRGEPELDYLRLRQINEALGIPLVIHGGTGLSDDQFRSLIANGVAKINYCTALADAAGAAVGENVGENRSGGYTGLARGVQDAVAEEVERCIRLWGSAGRAADVLSECTPWLPVVHLIVYNVEGLDAAGMQEMMAEGRRVLGAIPGVREVFTGEAVQTDAAYRYTWLVRFCHPAVIDSYRDHPAHVAFADQCFRPVAGNRLTIDYQEIETGNEEQRSNE
jgi:fructose-bisphosphate aldolase class II